MTKMVTLPNGRSFPSQKAAKEHFKSILDRARENPFPYEITDPQEKSDIIALARRMDECGAADDKKVGISVHSVFVAHVKDQKYFRKENACFHLVSHETGCNEFSYTTAISGKKRTQRQDFQAAVGALRGEQYVDPKQLKQEIDQYLKSKGWEKEIPDGVLSESEPNSSTTRFTCDTVKREIFELIQRISR